MFILKMLSWMFLKYAHLKLTQLEYTCCYSIMAIHNSN